MMKLMVSAVGILALCAAACGDGGDDASGGSDPGGGGANGGTGGTDPSGGGGASGDLQFSCDNPNNGARLCTDWTIPAAIADAIGEELMADCEPDGGTLGDACDTTGAAGGCRIIDSGAPGVIITTWVYTGTASDVMGYCTMLMAEFVSPP